VTLVDDRSNHPANIGTNRQRLKFNRKAG